MEPDALLVNTGDEFIQSDSGMITTLASDVGVMRSMLLKAACLQEVL